MDTDRQGTLAADTSMRVRRVAAPVRQQVSDQLRNAIVQMRFRPGQRLTERELTELTGVSRPTIREALQQLTAEGLVTTAPGKGWVVAAPTAEEAEDLYAVRALLEGLAGRRFAERATPEKVEELRLAAVGVEAVPAELSDRAEMMRAKARFYDVLLDGADSTTIVSIISGLHARVTVLRAVSMSQPGRRPESIKEIRAIVDAIAAGDPGATERACVFHVQQAARAAVTAMSQEDVAQQDDRQE